MIIILAVACLTTAFWQLGAAKMAKDIILLNRERADLQSSILELEMLQQESRRIEAELAGWASEFDRLEFAVPFLSELSTVLGNFETAIGPYSESLRSLQVSDTEFKNDHASVSLTLNLQGETDRMFDLLRELDDFPHLMVVDEICWLNESGNRVELALHFRLILICADQLSFLP